MDDNGILGNALGQLGSIAKTTGQQIVKIPEEMTKDLGVQVKGAKPQKQWQSDEERIKFLRDLYGPDKTVNPLSKKPTEFEAKIADKSPDEQKKLTDLRQQLHKQNYYDPTFNPPQKQEERPAEKVEKEKKIEMQELRQKEAEKPPPLAVQRVVQRIEKIPGAG